MRRKHDVTSSKISPELHHRLSVTADHTPMSVIVRYRPNAPIKLPKSPGVRVRRFYKTFTGLAAELTPDNVRSLAADDSVANLWLDFTVHALLDKAAPAVKADVIWESGAGGAGVNIAILDTGIDPEHPDFGDRIVSATSCIRDECVYDESGVHFGSTLDRNGHGTHVAGIAAGDGTASDGLYRGIAPEANILAAKVLRDDGSGEASDVIAGLEWAYANHADIVCLSLGNGQSGDGTDALSEACDEFVERGMIICAAAGNAGPRPRTIGPPACAKQVITVGAADLTQPDAGTARVAVFSSRGPTSDNRTKPDIVLPGVGITSCRATDGSLGEPDERFAEFYVSASGTSMAAPIAAGACALLLELCPEAIPSQIRQFLCQSARSLGEDANAQGCGLPDLSRAAEALKSIPLPQDPRGLPQGCLPSIFPLPRVLRQLITR